MIRKLKSGEYRLYSRKKDPKTGKCCNLATLKTRTAAANTNAKFSISNGTKEPVIKPRSSSFDTQGERTVI